jgi:hypothetical protein
MRFQIGSMAREVDPHAAPSRERAVASPATYDRLFFRNATVIEALICFAALESSAVLLSLRRATGGPSQIDGSLEAPAGRPQEAS